MSRLKELVFNLRGGGKNSFSSIIFAIRYRLCQQEKESSSHIQSGALTKCPHLLKGEEPFIALQGWEGKSEYLYPCFFFFTLPFSSVFHWAGHHV